MRNQIFHNICAYVYIFKFYVCFSHPKEENIEIVKKNGRKL